MKNILSLNERIPSGFLITKVLTLNSYVRCNRIT